MTFDEVTGPSRFFVFSLFYLPLHSAFTDERTTFIRKATRITFSTMTEHIRGNSHVDLQ